MSSPKQNKDLLGKGIRSLLQGIDSDLKTGTGALKQTVVENVTGINRIAVDQVEPNPKPAKLLFKGSRCIGQVGHQDGFSFQQTLDLWNEGFVLFLLGACCDA